MQLQFAKADLPSYQRYSLGIALGFTPLQIHVMHRDIGKYFRMVFPERSNSGITFEDEVRTRKEALEYRNACIEFEKLFPNETSDIFYAVRLDLNSKRNAYDLEVLSKSYKEFRLKDPITPEKIEQLYLHLISLGGERSKKILLESAA